MSHEKEWCASHTVECRTKGRSQVERNEIFSKGYFTFHSLTLYLRFDYYDDDYDYDDDDGDGEVVNNGGRGRRNRNRNRNRNNDADDNNKIEVDNSNTNSR